MGTYTELLKLGKEQSESKAFSKRPTNRQSVAQGTTSAKKRTKKRRTTRQSTSASDESRDTTSDKARGKSHDRLRDLPTRDEIQEFSFQLRDELKVKVQAEVPHKWQKELEEIALQLDVKKLELYRFILGEFLGKVKRRNKV